MDKEIKKYLDNQIKAVKSDYEGQVKILDQRLKESNQRLAELTNRTVKFNRKFQKKLGQMNAYGIGLSIERIKEVLGNKLPGLEDIAYLEKVVNANYGDIAGMKSLLAYYGYLAVSDDEALKEFPYIQDRIEPTTPSKDDTTEVYNPPISNVPSKQQKTEAQKYLEEEEITYKPVIEIFDITGDKLKRKEVKK